MFESRNPVLLPTKYTALGKREYLMNFSYFSLKLYYVVTSHLNRLIAISDEGSDEGCNMFLCRINKKYS